MQKNLDVIKFRRQLNRVRQPKNDVEAVITFLLSDNTKLTTSQDQLCTRLIYTDALIRKREKGTDDIVKDLMDKFNISRYRAEQDIYDCQKVFGETRKTVKPYLLSHHIENITLQIKKCEDVGDLKTLPKLYEALTNAIKALPEEEEGKEPPPAMILFQFNGKPPVEKGSLEETLEEAENLLNPTVDGEYITIEEDSSAEHATDGGAAGAGQ